MEKIKRKLPVYRMKVNEQLLNSKDNNIGVNFISLVEDPATGIEWVALNDEQPTEQVEYKIQDPDKRYLVSVILQPEQVIYRNPSKKIPVPHAFVMDSQTIELTANYFIKKGFATNINQSHIKGSTVDAWLTQSWLVEDPKQDKTALYFKDVKPGSWAGVTYVHDEQYWINEIKSGKLKGFSIEGAFTSYLDDFIEMEFNKDEPEDEILLQKCLVILQSYKD